MPKLSQSVIFRRKVAKALRASKRAEVLAWIAFHRWREAEVEFEKLVGEPSDASDPLVLMKPIIASMRERARQGAKAVNDYPAIRLAQVLGAEEDGR